MQIDTITKDAKDTKDNERSLEHDGHINTLQDLEQMIEC